jgi:hypothetical protein
MKWTGECPLQGADYPNKRDRVGSAPCASNATALALSIIGGETYRFR